MQVIYEDFNGFLAIWTFPLDSGVRRNGFTEPPSSRKIV